MVVTDDQGGWDKYPPWETPPGAPAVEEPLGVLRPFRRIPLDLTKAPEPPSFLVRWLYAACLTILQSEPGVGKSWVALWLTVQVIEAGYAVVYIDEEGGSELITERLVALGADPAMVEERVFYYAFESRTWGEEDLLALDDVIRQASAVGQGLGLAVLDSLPDFLAAAGLSEDSSMDVTAWVKKVCDRFRAVGTAVLLLDHLVKPASEGKARRSRYGRGSGAKLAKADATLLLECVNEFDATTSGLLRVWKTKDRRGRLTLPPITKPGLDLEVTVNEGSVAFTERGITEQPAWDGPTQCMAAVGDFLRSSPDVEFSTHQIYTNLKARSHGFRSEVVAEAAERMALTWEDIGVRNGPRRARLFHAVSQQMEVF